MKSVWQEVKEQREAEVAAEILHKMMIGEMMLALRKSRPQLYAAMGQPWISRAEAYERKKQAFIARQKTTKGKAVAAALRTAAR